MTRLSDIEKLVKLDEQIKELNELKKQLKDEESYDNAEVSISPNVVIKVEWSNTTGNFAKVQQFPFSAISDIGERFRKKCDYRKSKLKTDV